MADLTPEDRERIYREEKEQIKREMAEARRRAGAASAPLPHPANPWREAPPAKNVWPPPPAGQPLPPSLDPSVRAQVSGHLNTAKWMIVLGFFFLPIVFIPIAIYHAAQANAIGRRGQGNPMIVAAVIAGLLSCGIGISILVNPGHG